MTAMIRFESQDRYDDLNVPLNEVIFFFEFSFKCFKSSFVLAVFHQSALNAQFDLPKITQRPQPIAKMKA